MYYVISLRSRNSDITFISVYGSKTVSYTNYLESAKVFSKQELDDDPRLNNNFDYIAVSEVELCNHFMRRTSFCREVESMIELIGQRIKPN